MKKMIFGGASVVILLIASLFLLSSCGDSDGIKGECEDCGSYEVLYECWEDDDTVEFKCKKCANEWKAKMQEDDDEIYKFCKATTENYATDEIIDNLLSDTTWTFDLEDLTIYLRFNSDHTLSTINPEDGRILCTGSYKVACENGYAGAIIDLGMEDVDSQVFADIFYLDGKIEWIGIDGFSGGDRVE